MKRSMVIGVLVLSLAAILTVALMPREARAIDVYKYQWTWDWSFHGKWDTSKHSEADAIADAVATMENDAKMEFGAEMVNKGFWFKLDDLSSTCTLSNVKQSLEYMWPYDFEGDFKGTVTIHFYTDESYSDYQGSGTSPSGTSVGTMAKTYSLMSYLSKLTVQAPIQPTLASEFVMFLYTVLHYIWVFFGAHQTLLSYLIFIAAVVIGAWALHNIGGIPGTLFPNSGGLGADILTAMVIIGAICVLVPSIPAALTRLIPERKSSGKKKK